jgi:hypothetical protein
MSNWLAIFLLTSGEAEIASVSQATTTFCTVVPMLNNTQAQTPLVRFVVDLLYNKLYSNNKSTTNPQLFDKSTTNPQHLDMSRCCGFVVDSTAIPQQIESVEYGSRLVYNKSKSCTTNRKAVQQIHSKSTTLRKVVQLVVQQIHSKSTTNRTSGVWASWLFVVRGPELKSVCGTIGDTRNKCWCNCSLSYLTGICSIFRRWSHS